MNVAKRISKFGTKLHFALGIAVEILFSAMALCVAEKDWNGKPDPACVRICAFAKAGECPN